MDRRIELVLKIALVVCFSGAAVSAQTGSASRSKSSSLSGTVTNSVTGEPVPHAHVSVWASGPSRAYGAITLADGRFSISEIPSGSYTAHVERYGYSPQDDNDKAVELKAGERVSDLALRLVPDAVISGRVLDANGVPMEKTGVVAVSIRGVAYARTDDRGEFRIGGLHQGRYLVKAPGLWPLPAEIRTDGTVESNYSPTYYPSATNAGAAAVVQVRAGQETSGIEIKLVRSPILHISGTVLNVPENFRSNVNVQLTGGAGTGTTRIGPDMQFTTWRVQPGHYQLFAECMDLNRKSLRSAPVEITVTNTSIEGLSLPLSPAYELAGQVSMEGGEQLPERIGRAALMLRSPNAFVNMLGYSNFAADGSFKLAEVFPGRYYVAVRNLPANVYIKSARVGTAESADNILDLRGLAEAGVLTVQLGTNGAEVSGIVRDAKGPVAGMPVLMLFDSALGTGEFGSVSTGADGSYRFEGVPPGKYTVLAWDNPNRGGSSSQDEAWFSDVMAIYAGVTEHIDVMEGDKISQDLKLLGLP